MRKSAMPVTELSCVISDVRELMVRLHIASHDLDVDRRRKAEIENLADDVGRREIEQHAWKRLCSASNANRECILPSAGAFRYREIMMSASSGPMGAEVLYV